MLNKKESNKDTIVVYWAPATGYNQQDYGSFFSEAPIPLLKTFPGREKRFVDDNLGYKSCRAMLNLFKNTYVINSPVTSTVKILQDNKHIPDIDDGGSNYWIARENPFENINRVDLDFGYIFFAEEDLVMRQVPPYMHKPKSASSAWMSAGSYDISKWFRPILSTYVLWEGEKEVSVVKGEPAMYLQFETNKRIIFKRFEYTNSMHDIVLESLAFRAKNTIASLDFLYDAFNKSYRNKKVLKLIKENLLD